MEYWFARGCYNDIVVYTDTGGDDHSEHSDYSISTSGSVVPQLEQPQGALQPNTQHKDMNSSHVSQGNASLFP